MQTNSNKITNRKEISSILESLESLTLSSNHGIPTSSSNRRTSSSSSSSGSTWSIKSSPRKSLPSFIRTTPPEILAHIFSFLDPEGFANASLVCREWHSVSSDDYAWKVAFERFFGKLKVIPRLSTSWRGEYIHRSHLIRKWQFGRGPVSVYDTGFSDNLTMMSELPPLQKGRQTRQPLSRAIGKSFLLHGNLVDGLVTASDPTTGQRFREPIVHPDTGRIVTQSIAFHNNIVAFGTALGRVSIVDINNRRKVDSGWKPMRQQHDTRVTTLLLLPVPFKVDVPGIIDGASVSLISASLGGEISLHDIRTGINHGLYRIRDEPIVRMVTYLDYDHETNIIIAGTCTGDIWIWKPIPNSELRRIESSKYDSTTWEKEQDVLLHEATGILSPETDIFFLSDFKNHSVIVVRGTSIRRHNLMEPGTTTFTSPLSAKYSCTSIDPDHPDAENPRLFAVGDIYGSVSIYNARQSASEVIPPLYTITPVPDIKVTAVALNSLVIITGSIDGTAKAFSTLNGTHLRTLCAPNSRRRRQRPPSPTFDPTQNPITAISLPHRLKSEVRGAIAFKHGSIRYWNFAPDGVGIILRSKKRRQNRTSAKEIRGFVDDEIERDEQEAIEDATKRKRWEKMNGGIEEEDIAIQVAMMMSREESERRREFEVDPPIDEEVVDVDLDDREWIPGRKISFGGTSGSGSPSVGRLEDVAVFRRGKAVESGSESRFEEDLEFAIRLSLAEQESRESSVARE